MNKFSRVCARALTVGLLSLGVVSGGGVGATAPEAAALTPEEQHQFLVDPFGAVSVSYTHLTLPTICSV